MPRYRPIKSQKEILEVRDKKKPVVKREIKEDHHFTVGREDLLTMLRKFYREIPFIPYDAVLSVRVPGGGDWSNSDLELDENATVLDISWTVRRTEQI